LNETVKYQMNSREYQICKRCVMDTTDTEIKFDENGFCNHCSDFFKNAHLHTYQGNESDKKLQSVVDKIKRRGRNKEYDCLIGISGGVDSSYVTYCSKELGLRPLIVHFDNGWDSELSIKNIENVVKKLEFEYQTYVVDWEEFKDVQIAFLKASVIDMETPTDHAFLAALYKICITFRIKYVITGSNYATECILPQSWSYNAKDLRQLRSIYRKFGSGNLVSFPTLGFFREFYYTYIRGIRLIRLLQYMPYSKTKAIAELNNELGWQYYGGKHYESLFTKFSQAYILPLKFNVDKRKAHLSTLICNGEMTRNEATEILKSELYPSEQLAHDKEYVCKKFGIDETEFNQILTLPVKTYKDYPNSEKLLGLVYRIYYYLRKN
jgi:N-acetyl sugar amidotransferase